MDKSNTNLYILKKLKVINNELISIDSSTERKIKVLQYNIKFINELIEETTKNMCIISKNLNSI